jgi:phage gpG-like protein
MALRVRLNVSTPKPSSEDIALIAARARDAKPAMRVILNVLIDAERRAFETQGSITGRRWDEDTPAWRIRKGKEGKPQEPLRYTDRLMRSLTQTKARGGIRRVTKQQAVLGTMIFYARFQKRPVLARLRYAPGVIATCQDILVNWLLEGKPTK